MPLLADDSKERFSDRVADYVRSRPGYPKEVFDFLHDDLKLKRESVVADIGSGTGISTRPLLDAGHVVFAIEPNAAMRAAAESSLAEFPGFKSVDASAETTTLGDRSADLVFAGQAFHWFDPIKARAEFLRILKPGGWVALVWNERRIDATPFLRDYENLLNAHGTDYHTTKHEIVTENITTLFGPTGFQTRRFDNRQSFDYPGLEARVLSSSYTRAPVDPRRGPMLAELRRIFDRHIDGPGGVSFEYDTRVYYGRLI